MEEPAAEKEKRLDLIVLAYMKKRGYKQAEGMCFCMTSYQRSIVAFKQDANLQSLPIEQLASNASLEQDVSVSQYIMFHNNNENLPQRYNESYVKLREWIHTSLDLYKVWLIIHHISVYFAIFIYCVI